MSAAGRRVRPRANRSDAAPAPRAAAIAPVGGDRVTTALIVALAAGVLLRVFAAALPGNALWGWDAWRDLPRAAAIGLACASVLAFVPAVGNAARRALEPAGRALDRGPWAPALLAAAFAALVLLARDDVRFVGDATFRLAAVSVRGDDARTLPQIGPLDRLLNVALPRVLDDALPMGPAGALQLAGALQALAFAAAAVAFVRALPAGTLARAGALVVLLSSGVPVHFAGYAKFGPLCIGLLLLAAGLARLARDGASRAGAAQLVAGLAIALLAHRTGLLAAPAALAGAALAARPRDGRPAPRAAQLALVAAFAGTLAALPWAAGLLQRYDRARHLADAGITPARLRDAFDVLGVFAPLAPAGVVAAGFAWPRVPAPARAVAALYALPWFALLATVTGSQGAPRDWDMHAAAGLVAAAGTAAALALAWEHGERARRTIGTAALVALAAGASLWLLHGDARAQLARVDRQLADRALWSDESAARAHDFLGTRAYGLERWNEAVVHWEAAAKRSPNSRYFYQVGLSHARAGRFAQAAPWIEEAHRRDPSNPDPFIGRALLAMAGDDEPAATAWLDSALARNPRKWDALRMKRMLAEDAGR